MKLYVSLFYLAFIQRVVHSLYKAKLRFEQGVWFLPTVKLSGYYDYLYIQRSSYANNFSTLPKIRG
jgi:hypothetical protein